MTQLPSLIEPGCQLDDIYHVKHELGRGGMAIVYEADVNLEHFDFALLLAYHDSLNEQHNWVEREKFREERYAFWKKKPRVELVAQTKKNKIPFPKKRKCALKVMYPNSKAALRFEAEWKQLCGNNHPNLIHVYGGSFWKGYNYYAMELIPEIYKLEVLQSGLTLTQKVDIIIQTANGLESLHTRGIIHRDIKPNNIIVFSDGNELRVKISDLGIAKDTTRTAALTLPQQMMGTPYYMSPEQVKHAQLVDHRSDIYSLGASLYCLVCGVPPYHGMEMHETLVALATRVPPMKPRDVCKDIPVVLEKIILAMIAYEPDDRPCSISDVKKALLAYLRKEPVSLLSSNQQNIQTKQNPQVKHKKGSDEMRTSGVRPSSETNGGGKRVVKKQGKSRATTEKGIKLKKREGEAGRPMKMVTPKRIDRQVPSKKSDSEAHSNKVKETRSETSQKRDYDRSGILDIKEYKKVQKSGIIEIPEDMSGDEKQTLPSKTINKEKYTKAKLFFLLSVAIFLAVLVFGAILIILSIGTGQNRENTKPDKTDVNKN